jgi:hypothetical protein
VGVFIKKGVPRNHEQKVLWLRTLNDGYLKSKGKRLQNPRATNDFPTIFSVLQSFLINQNMEVRNITKLQKAIKIDFTDTNLELVPEAYLDDEAPTVEEMRIEVEKIMKDTAAFMVKSSRE